MCLIRILHTSRLLPDNIPWLKRRWETLISSSSPPTSSSSSSLSTPFPFSPLVFLSDEAFRLGGAPPTCDEKSTCINTPGIKTSVLAPRVLRGLKYRQGKTYNVARWSGPTAESLQDGCTSLITDSCIWSISLRLTRSSARLVPLPMQVGLRQPSRRQRLRLTLHRRGRV